MMNSNNEKVEIALKRYKPFICLAVSMVILMLTSCAPAVNTPAVSTPVEISLPEKVRVKGATWVADDILAYYAEDGVHIWNAESGEGSVLAVSDTFNTDERANFALSPDRSKLCVSTMSLPDINNQGKRSYDVFDVKSCKLIKHLELTDSFKELTGIWRYGYDFGFFNEDTLYAYNIFGVWFVDINTGEQRRISADAVDFYKSCDGDEQDYFEWVYAPVLVQGKLYYSGIRNKNHQSRIYCADLSGETELNIPGDVGILDSVPGHGFVYTVRGQSEDQVWYYDIKNSVSDIISERMSSYMVIRDGEIAYHSTEIANKNYVVCVYNINTKQTQTIEIYNTARDFPEEDYSQLERISGFIPDSSGYAFLFTVGHQSKTESMIIGKYLAYSTETDKAMVVADYSDFWLTETTISPSGDYTLITNHNLHENGYPFKVVKTSEYIHPDSTK